MTDELRLERVIDAPPETVFEAFTTYEGQVAFYGSDDPGWIVESEFTFAEQDGRTLMTVIQSGFPTRELRDEHGRGVPNAFARLERAIRAST